MAKNGEKLSSDGSKTAVYDRYLIVLFFGFALIVVGTVVVVLASALGGGATSFGGFIFIGPFPIVFGAGPSSTWLVAISIAIAIFALIAFVIMRRRF